MTAGVIRAPALAGTLPSAQGGRGWCVGREAAMVIPLFARHSTMKLCFYVGPCFLHEHSHLQISSLLSHQAVSSQPTVVISPSLLSKLHIPAPSTCLHWRTHLSDCGAQGCGKDNLCRSHSVLPTTDRLLLSRLIAPEAPLLSQLISPPVRRLPLIRNLSSPSAPHRGAGPIPLPLLFLFPSSFFCPTWLCGDLFCPFRCPRASASVQQVLCENCSICRCILDAFVGRDELHILLLLCHLDSSRLIMHI